MTSSVITNQTYTVRTRAIAKNVSTLSENATATAPDPNSHRSDYEAMVQQQELLSKEELAPDWVWEYGVMG